MGQKMPDPELFGVTREFGQIHREPVIQANPPGRFQNGYGQTGYDLRDRPTVKR